MAKPAEGLRLAIEEMAAIDHHAHLLSGPAAWALTDLLSESADPRQRLEVRHHPAYHRARRDLGRFLGLDPAAPVEDALAAARDNGFDDHTRRLLDACRLDAMLVDDGFPVPGSVDLDTQAELAGCSVHRVMRIEAVAEEAAGAEWPAFAEVRDRFRQMVAAAVDGGAAALKTIAAYRCGLDLPPPERSEAESAYAAWRRTARHQNPSRPPRLQDPALVAFFVAEALESVRGRPVPLQVHTGLGDADLALHRADPSLLGPIVDHAAAVGAPVVVLHSYPYVRQAAWLASVHLHVFVDLSLALLLASHRGTDLVLEALALAPATKVLFATDASRAAEMFFLAARWWRDALAGALGDLVAGDVIDEATALGWAELILAGNARRLYGL